MIDPKGGKPADGNGLKIAGALIGGVLLIAYLVGPPSTQVSTNYNGSTAATLPTDVSPAPAPAPPPVEALSRASITRGTSHYRAATGAEGLLGGRIYSENCFAALSRSFSWAKLDQCGAFDIAAARAAEEAFDSPTAVLDYFGSETAATRYLRAATAAGAAPGAADERYGSLASATPRRRQVQAAAPAEEITDISDSTSEPEPVPLPVVNSTAPPRESLAPDDLDAVED
jgi:hypothetical protein